MLVKLKPILLGVIGLALLLASVGVIATQLGKSAEAVVAPVIVAGEADLSGLRVMKSAGRKPSYAAHETIPARFSASGPAVAIVGGQQSDFTRIPGAVLVEAVTEESAGRRGFQQCTGAVTVDFGPQYVLLAGHCAEPTALRYDIYYQAEAGTTRNEMRRLWGHRIYIAPDYQRATLAGDFALIKLVEPVRLEPHQMARLATQAELRKVAEGTTLVSAGWGTTIGGDVVGDKPSPHLKEALQVVERAGLLNIVISDPERQIEGNCQGDSGNGARLESQRRVIVGVLSSVDRVTTQVPGEKAVCGTPGFRSNLISVSYIRLATGLF